MKSDKTDITLAQRLRQFMLRHQAGWQPTISTAESCTSGRIAATITSIDGASRYYQGGIVAYQDEIKVQELCVSQDSIIRHGVVSTAVARQMAVGCLKRFHTDYAIATTGYTGAGNDQVPSGTVCIGFACLTPACRTGRDRQVCNDQDTVSSTAIHINLTQGTREEKTAAAAQAAISRFLEWAGHNAE